MSQSNHRRCCLLTSHPRSQHRTPLPTSHRQWRCARRHHHDAHQLLRYLPILQHPMHWLPGRAHRGMHDRRPLLRPQRLPQTQHPRRQSLMDHATEGPAQASPPRQSASVVSREAARAHPPSREPVPRGHRLQHQRRAAHCLRYSARTREPNHCEPARIERRPSQRRHSPHAKPRDRGAHAPPLQQHWMLPNLAHHTQPALPCDAQQRELKHSFPRLPTAQAADLSVPKKDLPTRARTDSTLRRSLPRQPRSASCH